MTNARMYAHRRYQHSSKSGAAGRTQALWKQNCLYKNTSGYNDLVIRAMQLENDRRCAVERVDSM
eukprot:7624187-Pyramimonas_sp.AAC.1